MPRLGGVTLSLAEDTKSESRHCDTLVVLVQLLVFPAESRSDGDSVAEARIQKAKRFKNT